MTTYLTEGNDTTVYSSEFGNTEKNVQCCDGEVHVDYNTSNNAAKASAQATGVGVYSGSASVYARIYVENPNPNYPDYKSLARIKFDGYWDAEFHSVGGGTEFRTSIFLRKGSQVLENKEIKHETSESYDYFNEDSPYIDDFYHELQTGEAYDVGILTEVTADAGDGNDASVTVHNQYGDEVHRYNKFDVVWQ